MYYRVKTVINKNGIEKHYPQKGFLIFWWNYSVKTLDNKIVNILNNNKYDFWLTNFNWKLVTHQSDDIYFHEFYDARDFVFAVERTIPAQLKAISKEKPKFKEQTIIRPINFYSDN